VAHHQAAIGDGGSYRRIATPASSHRGVAAGGGSNQRQRISNHRQAASKTAKRQWRAGIVTYRGINGGRRIDVAWRRGVMKRASR
jgi:hypothetical protein